jgi:phage terminase large subunit-like protein
MMAGYDAKGVRPGGDKLTRSRALAAQAEVGNVKLLRGPWNEDFLRHMHAIPDGDHDDIHDAAALAFNGTNQEAGVQVVKDAVNLYGSQQRQRRPVRTRTLYESRR